MQTTSAPGLRWLVVARLGDTPSARNLPLAETLDQLGLTTQVDLGPTLGAVAELPVTLTFTRLSSFSVANVLTAAPLSSLVALSQRLGGPPSKCPAPAELLAAVASVTGEGRLHRELTALFAPSAPPAEATPSPAPTPPGADLVAELLAAPATVAHNRPAAIVDAILGSGRTPRPPARESAALRAARDYLDITLAAAARAALDDPTVRARESLWRGLKLLHGHTPTASGLRVRILDSDLTGLPALLDALVDDEPMDRPDAIFLADPVTDLTDIPALVGHAAAIHVPLVISLDPAALACADLDALTHLADDGASIPASWTALRDDDDSRWLAAAVNPYTLVSEGAGPARRVLFGAPALALAAILSASARDTGGLASLARPGIVRAPNTWDPTTGPDTGASIPTARFAPLRTQARLAALGLTALGSPRNSDSLVVAACPTVRASADAVSLPAQILTGRIVRFAFWALAQVPPGSPAAAVVTLFSEAAKVFLFPGLPPEAANLGADVDTTGTHVTITASVHPSIAGARLEIQFSLPLPTLA